MNATSIYTIGHRRHKLPHFVGLLKNHQIKLVVDVRSAPYSRIAPHFNFGELEPQLVKYFMYYKYMGNTLGGRPSDSALQDADGRADYGKMSVDPRFNEGIERLATLARERVTCLMCGEEDPAKCHRALLIAPELIRRGMLVKHIRSDSRAVDHETIQAKVAPAHPVPGQLELF